MIGLVRGEVVVRRPDHVVVLAGGVGYRLAVSAETLRHVPAAGSETTLHAHLIVRDDALNLYGFATEEERDLFLLLLGVQAVGPKVALAVLSGGTPRDLLRAIAGGDALRFQAVPGIGKRTAERIVVELRDKLGAVALESVTGSGSSAAPAADDPHLAARDALVALGFAVAEAETALAGTSGGTEQRLKEALAALRRGGPA